MAQAFLIGADFLGSDSATLILGDNISYGDELTSQLRAASATQQGATVFAYPVDDPERYGVVEFDQECCAQSIEEEPN